MTGQAATVQRGLAGKKLCLFHDFYFGLTLKTHIVCYKCIEKKTNKSKYN